MAIRNLTSPDNPLAQHLPPKYDIYGHPVKYAKKDLAVSVPSHWNTQPKIMTQTELLEKRKADLIPDPSFDLDGDGQVGGQDLVLGKRFDKDKDGKLNGEEIVAARQAIKDGIHNQYVWGVEQSGPFRPYRIMQKRGVIIDNDDFGPIEATYSREPLPEPLHKSLSHLKDAREADTKNHITRKQREWDLSHPKETFAVVRCDDHYVAAPKFATQSKKREVQRSEARAKIGLVPSTDINTVSAPTLAYAEKPNFSTRRQLNEAKRKDQLESLASKKNYDYINGDIRIAQREEKQVVIVRDGENRTWTAIKEQQRLDTNEYNLKTFTQRSIGIHGTELPKFAEHKPAYWEKPKSMSQQNSRVKLTKAHRYWGAPDPLKIADVEGYVPPQPLKKDYDRISKTPDLPEKPNQIVHNGWKPRDPSEPLPPPPKHNYRWSTMVHYFANGSVFAPPSAVEVNSSPPKGVGKKEVKVRLGNVSITSHEGQSSSLMKTENSARSYKPTTNPRDVKRSGSTKQPQRQTLKTSGFAR